MLILQHHLSNQDPYLALKKAISTVWSSIKKLYQPPITTKISHSNRDLSQARWIEAKDSPSANRFPHRQRKTKYLVPVHTSKGLSPVWLCPLTSNTNKNISLKSHIT